MTDQAVNPAGQAAPATPATQTHAAAPAAVPASDAAKPADPNWLNGRIAQAKTSATTELLKSLGASSVDEAKAAVEAARAAAEAKKTAEQRALELDGQLKNAAQQRDKLAGVIKARAELELKALTPEQLAAVTGIAGEDPAEQLRAIDMLKPTWGSSASATTAPPAAVVPPTTNTAPARTAPPATTPNQTVTHSARFAELQKTNPFAAAEYLRQHGAAIAEGK